MHEIIIDQFDRAILNALQRDASLTNAALSNIVNLSASQCSRRRAALEATGVIKGYTAQLNERALGFGLVAITRVNLNEHNEKNAAAFARFLEGCPQVQSAYSVSGDADYILQIQVRTLDEFADFVHRRLLPYPHVAQVRSEIVLNTLKKNHGLPLHD